MRLRITKCKNCNIYYVIKTIYVDKKEKTITIERLGNDDDLKKKANGEDPILWAKKYIEKLNKEEKEKTRKIMIPKFQNKLVEKNTDFLFNCGYLFLEKIYYELRLDKICKSIGNRHKFEYNLNDILSKLIYSRIIYPSSKLKTYDLSRKFIEQPNFSLNDLYRSLDIIAKESDYIQSQIYKNSANVIDRNSKILYYDCTNYFFEIEKESGLKQYGPSKEHRPNPIVQMGLFIDGNGIPLAFCINPGNQNEQLSLTPLEEKILKDFELSKFIVCTDAGLSSAQNRKFNSLNDRAFITAQSVKKLKGQIKEWALSSKGWKIVSGSQEYDISKLDEEKYKDTVFYKETSLDAKESKVPQRLIVTFSFKYKNYLKTIRENQINRAIKALTDKNIRLDKVNLNDYRRFIKKESITNDGEVAENQAYSLNQDQIDKEAIYDGYYAVCTNLDGNVSDIININKRRWEIEESFRIMKTEFKSRPVYLSDDERIKAHFTTCFLSLLIYRILEKKLDEKYTCDEIIDCLRNMNLLRVDEGYLPSYIRNNLTDQLHEKMGFRTDYEIVSNSEIKNILKLIKK